MSDLYRPDPVRVCARCRFEIGDEELAHHLGVSLFHADCHSLTLRDARRILVQAARNELDAGLARKQQSDPHNATESDKP